MSFSIFKLHRILAVVFITGFVAANIFAIGPVVLLLPALYVALSPPSLKEEAKGRGYLINFGLFLSTFGAYAIVYPMRALVIDEVRFISLDPLDRFSALGKSLKSAVDAHREGVANLPFIDTLQFLSAVEYASYWGLIIATFLTVLTAPAVRGAVGRRLVNFEIKASLTGKFAFPQWIAGLVLMAVGWSAMYLVNFATADLGHKGWMFMYVAPVSGAIFMIGAVLLAVCLRIIAAQRGLGPLSYLAIAGVAEYAADGSLVRPGAKIAEPGDKAGILANLRKRQAEAPAFANEGKFHQILTED